MHDHPLDSPEPARLLQYALTWAVIVGIILLASHVMSCTHAQKPAATPQAVAKPTPPLLPPTHPARALRGPDRPRILPPVPAPDGRSIFFGFDRALLTTESTDVLADLGLKLAGRLDLAVTIEGNCDERGSTEYNLALGQRRADMAKKYLVKMGVLVDHVRAVSFGSQRPRLPGHDEGSWQQNRRDDFLIKASK